MKNLVLSALCFVGLTQAAGCIITSDDTTGDGTGDLTVSWVLQSTDANGTVIASPCPPGDTIQINAKRGSDPTFTDTHFCSDGSGIADRLPPGQYIVWVTITDASGVTRFAESDGFQAVVAENANTPITIDLFTDRAFFQASWDLVRAGSPTTCAAVSAVNMSVLATVTGGANGFDDDRQPCSAGETGSVFTTTPVPIGDSYTVVIAALNAAEESIGDSAPQLNKSFAYGNAYTDLGVVTVPIR